MILTDIEITRLEIFDWNKNIQSWNQHRISGVYCHCSTKLVILNHSGLKRLDTIHSHNLKVCWLDINQVNKVNLTIKHEVYKNLVRTNDVHKIFYNNSVDRALVN